MRTRRLAGALEVAIYRDRVLAPSIIPISWPRKWPYAAAANWISVRGPTRTTLEATLDQGREEDGDGALHLCALSRPPRQRGRRGRRDPGRSRADTRGARVHQQPRVPVDPRPAALLHPLALEGPSRLRAARHAAPHRSVHRAGGGADRPPARRQPNATDRLDVTGSGDRLARYARAGSRPAATGHEHTTEEDHPMHGVAELHD